ncbi:hypothetical protein M3J09_002998 [Ascochyta lentis]
MDNNDKRNFKGILRDRNHCPASWKTISNSQNIRWFLEAPAFLRARHHCSKM